MTQTKAQREWIVRKLAAFYTPADVAEQFGAVFPSVTCTIEDVFATDPRTNIVDPDLWAAFKAERERVLEDSDAAPMVEQRARLLVLSRQAERYERNNQYAEARAVLRQIAEELGAIGKSTAKVELSGKVTIEQDPDELSAAIAGKLASIATRTG